MASYYFCVPLSASAHVCVSVDFLVYTHTQVHKCVNLGAFLCVYESFTFYTCVCVRVCVFVRVCWPVELRGLNPLPSD